MMYILHMIDIHFMHVKCCDETTIMYKICINKEKKETQRSVVLTVSLQKERSSLGPKQENVKVSHSTILAKEHAVMIAQ